MRYRILAAAAVLFLAITASAQWTNDASGVTNPNNTGMGVASHSVMRLRIAQATSDTPATGIQIAFGSTVATWWSFRLDSGYDLHLDRQGDNIGWQEGVIFKRNGDVGIGIAPAERLHVFEDANENTLLEVYNPNAGTNAVGALRARSDTAQVNLASHGASRTISRFGLTLGGWTELLSWQGNGLVMGTNHSAPLILGTNNTNRVHITPTGFVGIGTSTPNVALDVRGTAIVYGAARRMARFWDDTAMAAGVGGGIDFIGKYNAAGAYTQFANVKGVKANATDGDFTGNLVLSVDNNNGNVVEVARIGPTGTTMNGDLTVTGTVIGGNVQAKYQDVAEWVPAVDEVTPGMVVIVAADESNKVSASTEAYDTRVAGVASAQPGVILGEAGPSKVMIATTGRVKVRVDATAAPIKSGDLLVTSGKRGMAMKSMPVDLGGVKIHRPGTVVGKALESLASGEGEILVLLSLQ